MDMQEFVSGCQSCDPRTDPERAEELLKAAAELGEAILKNREKNASVPYQQIIDAYNQNCSKLPKATKLTDKRKRAIRTCMAQGFTVDEICEAFLKAASTPFLTGENDRFWRANFDFVIKPDNMQKILEGAYGSAAPQGEHSYDLDLIMQHAMNNTPKIRGKEEK